jgi:hypothetical protein
MSRGGQSQEGPEPAAIVSPSSASSYILTADWRKKRDWRREGALLAQG